MKIHNATITDQIKWDNFVQNHQDSTPYHLMAWTTAIYNAYGFKSLNLMAEENNEIVGIFPVTLFKIPTKRQQLVALPYCDIGTVLSTNHAAKQALLDAALSVAKTHNSSSIDIRGEIDNTSSQNCQYPVQTSNTKVRMLLDLPSSAEELWQELKSKLRSQVRKAEKNGLTFQLSNDKINDFYTVFCQNMRDLGSPVHSIKWFQEILKQFAANAIMGIVYLQNQPIGAGIILRAGNKISIPWASTLREHNRLGPNMLLYWRFLEYAANNNCQAFDFGRSTPNEGTYKFKSQWGAKPTPLPWHMIYLKGTPQTSTTESSNVREFVARTWGKMPLNIANYLGPKIRKYISL